MRLPAVALTRPSSPLSGPAQTTTRRPAFSAERSAGLACSRCCSNPRRAATSASSTVAGVAPKRTTWLTPRVERTGAMDCPALPGLKKT